MILLIEIGSVTELHLKFGMAKLRTVKLGFGSW